MGVNDSYIIQTEIAHAIAVGIYRDIGAWVTAAKYDNPENYERFKADYLARQAAQSSALVIRRRRIQNRSPTR